MFRRLEGAYGVLNYAKSIQFVKNFLIWNPFFAQKKDVYTFSSEICQTFITKFN